MAHPDDPGPSKRTDSAGTPTEPEREYKVGYRKPPLHTRFKPGQSGNPKGRPKHSRNLKSIVAEEMEAAVTITENGKRHTVSARQALIKKQKQLALQGDPKATAQLLALDQRFIEQEEGGTIQPFDTERDKEIIAAYLGQIKDDANE